MYDVCVVVIGWNVVARDWSKLFQLTSDTPLSAVYWLSDVTADWERAVHGCHGSVSLSVWQRLSVYTLADCWHCAMQCVIVIRHCNKSQFDSSDDVS